MNLNLTASDIKRFWSKVAIAGPDECWEWQGSKRAKSYGEFYAQKIRLGAHQVSYLLAHGSIPDGMHICHSCDNPPCVNPAHLWAGTPAQNIEDSYAKGRKKRSIKRLRRRLSSRRIVRSALPLTRDGIMTLHEAQEEHHFDIRLYRLLEKRLSRYALTHLGKQEGRGWFYPRTYIEQAINILRR